MESEQIDLAAALKWKYPEAVCTIHEGAIYEWNSSHTKQPDDDQIKQIISDYSDFLNQEKAAAVIEEQAVEDKKVTARSKFKKLGFTDEEINLFGI